MKKQKIVSGDNKITKYKLCNLTVFCKEKSPTHRRIKLLGLRIFKATKKEDDSGLVIREIYLGNIQVARVKKTSNKKSIYVFGIPVWRRKTEHAYYKYYLLGIGLYKKLIPCAAPVNVVSEKILTFPLTFPKYDKPTVSIIIPVYNQYKYTMQCLKSIFTSDDPTFYEIIIADDNSSDETKDIANFVSNIKISRNPTNLGYIQNCNNAAKLATGKYLYFLNNDTIVQKNWLSELVHVFDIRPDAGVVGSKIYNADGSLQECGVFMFADGFHNRFNDNPNDSRHMYLKPVDYVSGCSLLTPKKLFDDIGGFDIMFSPAYCDDPDYCIAALSKGYKTYVQPKSRIVHFGSITYGSKATPLAERNNKLLQEKWKDYFYSRKVSYVNPDNSSIGKQPVLLLIDDSLPQFDKHAGGKTIFQYCQMFIKMGLNVKFCPFFGVKEEPYFSILSDMGIEIIERDNVKTWIRNNYNRLDYLFLSRPQIAENFLIKQIRSTGVKVLYYGHDLHHVRMQREQAITNIHDNDQEISDMKLIEETTIKCVDWAYYPSILEEQYVKKEFDCKNVSTVPPYLYDVSNMPQHSTFEKSKDLLFVGSTHHGPNKDGLIWFIDNILPVITKKIPSLVLNIVGGAPTDEIKKRAGKHVKLLGYKTEEELSELYATSKISIAPLRYGAGIKGKVVDAIYHNTPVITTNIGAEGLDLSHGCVSVGNTEKEFAQLVIDLYTKSTLWNKQIRGCKQFISAGYSFDKAIDIFSNQITPNANFGNK